MPFQALPGVNIESEDPDSPEPPGLPEGYQIGKVSPISFNKYLAVEDLDKQVGEPIHVLNFLSL